MRCRSIAVLLILILVCLALPQSIQSQDAENIRFSHITVEDGLSHHETLFVFQDSQGFMWFGTKHGLNKYNGMRVTPFFNRTESPNSLGGNFTHWIHEDQAGNMWIATWGDGISRYNPQTGSFTNYYHEENDPQSLDSDFVWSLFIDSKGLVWAATDNGFSKLNPMTGSCVNFHLGPQNPNSLSNVTVSRIQEDNQGMLWISTYGGGLIKFDPNTETFIRYQHRQGDPQSLSSDNLWSVFIDSKHRIWIASEQGLNIFDPETEKFTSYQHDENDPNSLSSNTVTFINEDHLGRLWLGTFGGGLNCFHPEQKTFSHYHHNPHDPYSISNDIIMSITEDTAGTLWVATYGGIDKWDPGENQFQHFRNDPSNPNDLSSAEVNSIYQDTGGSLWIGTSSGLNRANAARSGFVHYLHDEDDPASISANDIRAIGQDQRGDLWIGTHGAGLNKFNPTQGGFVHYQHDPTNPNTLVDNTIYDLVVDQRRDVLWIAAYQSGLDRFDILEQTFTHYKFDANDANDANGIVSNWVTAVFVDSQGFVWVGTENGLSRFAPETEKFTNFKHHRDDLNSLSDNMIQAIYQDSRSVVWIGTNNGLNRYDDTTKGFNLYDQSDGLAGNRVAAITEDNEGLLWISTDQGLSRFNLQKGTFRNYDHRDGLQGNIFFMHSVYKNEAGNLFFGGVNGFNVIHPDELAVNQHVPRVVFTDFLLFNQPVQAGKESPLDQHINLCQRITLKHGQSVFSIEFVALNYTNSRKNQYAYMLEGFDKGFIHTGSDNRSTTYMNLDPGVYTFLVKAANNDGVWNQERASLEISIGAPWWRTWWFNAILVGLACLIVSAIIMYTRKLGSEVSRRRKNEQALRHSRERFRSLFEQAGDYILILEIAEDGSLVVVDANQAACEVHGYTHEELLGLSLSDFDRSLDKEQIQTMLNRLLSGETLLFETTHAKKDGTVFPVEVSSKLLETEADQNLLISIERDITLRKKAEARIQQQQYYLERAQELGRIGTWELDLERNILRWTDENCRIFGVPPGSVVNYEVFIEKVHPDDREYVNQEWQAGVAGKPYDIEHRLLIDGEITWVREKADVKFDEDGVAINAIGFTQDITERKQAEEERVLRSMAIEQAAESVVITDSKGTILYVNPAFETITGYRREEAIDQNPRIIKSGKHGADFYEQMWAVLVGGVTWSGRIINKRKDGVLFIEEATISPVRDAAGKIVNYVAVKRDVTHEAELEEHLRQAQKMEAIGTLAGGIAHDFNNILFAIGGFTELAIAEVDKGSPAYEMLKEVEKSSRRAVELVKQILTISSKKEKKLGHVMVHSVVQEVLKMLQGTLPTTIDIVQNIDTNCGPVIADATEIQQLALNLCMNAFHAMPERGGRLSLALSEVSLDDDEASQHPDLQAIQYIRFVVADTGCGMDAATMNRIFDPYFTTKDKGEGTGLGLATVQGIVHNYGGTVIVESELGQGSTFKIFIPRALQPETIGDEEAVEDLTRGHGERLLVVDDEASLARLYRISLERLGYRVKSFTAPGEALAAFRLAPSSFDLVVTDQTMPKITGAELSKQLLQIRPDIPIILSTGFSDFIDRETAMRTGIRAYLQKPIETQDLANIVRRLLDEIETKE